MAVFFDLDDGDDQQSHSQWSQDLRSSLPERRQLALSGKLKSVNDKTATAQTCVTTTITVVSQPEEEQVKLNKLAAALTCYP